MPARHIIEYADIVNETFSHELASAVEGNKPSKRLLVQVSFLPKSPPITKLAVMIGGEIQYTGDDLFSAVALYNTF